MGKMIIIPVQPNRFNGFDIVEMKLHRQIQSSGNSSENNPFPRIPSFPESFSLCHFLPPKSNQKPVC
jgi:hypothetical protein